MKKKLKASEAGKYAGNHAIHYYIKALPMENYAPMAVPQPKMDPTDLIHMENLLQRNCYGRIVGIHLHDVGHIVPPVLYNWVETHVLRRFLAFGFLACKQDVGVAIPID